MKKLPTPPRGLKAAGKKLWKKILAEWELDSAALAILGETCEALDRKNEAQGEIKSKGMLVKNRFKEWRPNPAIAVERDSRQAILRGLKALGLDLEPIRDSGGRPTESSRLRAFGG